MDQESIEIKITPNEAVFLTRLITDTKYQGFLDEIEQIVSMSRSILTKINKDVQRSDI